MGKKLLLKPLEGQFEQLSNAVSLQRVGLCHIMHTMSTEAVLEWLSSPAIDAIKFPSDPELLIEWLIDKKRGSPRDICTILWQQVDFPHPVLQQFEKISP